MSGRPKQYMIQGGDFNASFDGLADANDSLRARALHTVVDGDEHVDECRHRTRVIHTIQLVKPRRFVDTNGLHPDLEETGSKTRASTGLRLVLDRSHGGACCSFAEIENEIHGPHGTVLLDTIGLDRLAVGMDVDVAVSVEKSEIRSTTNGAARRAALGLGGRTECIHCAIVTHETAELPQEKIAVLEMTLACMGNDEPSSAGRRVVEKELERHLKKASDPKNTTKQNWINRESKRVEGESAKFAEMQESNRVRKETTRAAYEESKKLRADLLREGESMDKNSLVTRRAWRKYTTSNNKK